MANYFKIHKNKKPKKVKYSKPYTKCQYKNIQELVDIFNKKIEQLKNK
jgi:hypothetical protein